MMTPTTTLSVLGLSLLAGCLASPETPDRDARTAGAESTVITDDIKEISAIDRNRYPDSLGYFYQGSLAQVLWLQNQPKVNDLDDLLRHISRTMLRGVSGEIVSSQMQSLGAAPASPPPLPEMARQAVQSVRLMNQYAFVTSDYGDALGTKLSAYNASPARTQGIGDTAARVDRALRELVASHAVGSLPAAPPPPGARVLRPGQYFADAVKDHARALLGASVARLQRAIDAHDPGPYGVAFVDVFFLQRDVNLAKLAAEALAVHHVNGLLRGQPLDKVIATYVDRTRHPDRPLSVEQLGVINQLNLMAGKPGVARAPLVAALLLLDEDHQQGELDAAISSAAIWQHATDLAWLVSQYVRIKADGTTEAQLNALITSIVAGL